ncbi:hypothetical protein PH586_09300 [Pseudomonas sp. SA3-5]|uniref:AraC family transcriptional regulator n=1 Tax=Pseudomonas aestuarii TaxID=3018340 RepID=A0ABT4XED6_9PSED|nr:hypothetical protein [Pseudomonas aestuarii]MDA7086571.1 hypothetical protein [Pseudomonas aestuarii]
MRLRPAHHAERQTQRQRDEHGALYQLLSGYWRVQQLSFKTGAYMQHDHGPSKEGGG